MDLEISGLVATPRRFDEAELGRLPTTEARVPGRKGSPDATGPAFALAQLLDAVEPRPEATHATCRSADGGYTASIPLPELVEHGVVMLTPDGVTPWRLVVPDGQTLCWNVKGLIGLELTAGKVDDSVPEAPPH